MSGFRCPFAAIAAEMDNDSDSDLEDTTDLRRLGSQGPSTQSHSPLQTTNPHSPQPLSPSTRQTPSSGPSRLHSLSSSIAEPSTPHRASSQELDLMGLEFFDLPEPQPLNSQSYGSEPLSPEGADPLTSQHPDPMAFVTLPFDRKLPTYDLKASWQSTLQPSVGHITPEPRGREKLSSDLDEEDEEDEEPMPAPDFHMGSNVMEMGDSHVTEAEDWNSRGVSGAGSASNLQSISEHPQMGLTGVSPQASFSRRRPSSRIPAGSPGLDIEDEMRISNSKDSSPGRSPGFSPIRSPRRSPAGSFIARKMKPQSSFTRQMSSGMMRQGSGKQEGTGSSRNLIAAQQGSFTQTNKQGTQSYEKMGGYGSSRNLGVGGDGTVVRTVSMAHTLASQNSRASRSQLSRTGSRGAEPTKGPRPKRKRRVTSKAYANFSSWEAESFLPLLQLSWRRMEQMLDSSTLEMRILEALSPKTSDPELETLIQANAGFMEELVESLRDLIEDFGSAKMLHEKVRGMADHFQGFKELQVFSIGQAVQAVFMEEMKDDFSIDVQAAWSWLWSWLGRGLVLAIKELGQKSTALSVAWEIANENYTDEEIGLIFYDTLFDFAPNLKSLFHKPKQVLAMQFAHLLGRFVSFGADDDKTAEQIMLLGLSHVTYGSKRQHVTAMGQVVLATMEKAVGKEWTPEMYEDWNQRWIEICDQLMTAVEEAVHHIPIFKRAMTEADRIRPAHLGYCIFRRLAAKDPDSITEFTQKAGSPEYQKTYDPKIDMSVHHGHAAPEPDPEPLEPSAPADPEQTPPVSEIHPTINRRRSWVGKFGSALSMGAFSPEGDSSMSFRRGRTALVNQFASVKHFGQSFIGSASAFAHSSFVGRSMLSGHKNNQDLEAEQGEYELVGLEYFELIKHLTENILDPAMLSEKITLLASRFQKLGLPIDHLEALGHGIEDCFKNSFQTWGDEEAESWKWHWKVCTKLMSRLMRVNEAERVELLQGSWELAKDKVPAEQIGEYVFLELARIAPFTLHLLKRPKKIQAMQFVHAIELLILFTQDIDGFFEDVQKITVRHVKFGVKSDHIKPFGQAIISSIRKALDKEWTSEIESAWELLFENVAGFMSRALSSGTSLVNAALVQGDLDKLIDAMECCPRQDRVMDLTEVEVHGNVVSPLYWAIRDGKFSMAKFIIDDLLAIRADRNQYYYGREKLWESHPDIIHVLCQECPMLLEDLFDGHLWHSHTVLDGKFRINYYMKELYGDPAIYPDPWLSPICTLILEGHPQMFQHPLIEKLLEVKWQSVGKKGFLALQLYYTLTLIFFVFGYMVHSESCSPDAMGLRMMSGGLAALASLAMTVLILHQWKSHQVGIAAGYRVPRFLLNPSNILRYVSYLLLIVVSLSETCWREGRTPKRRKLGCPSRAGNEVVHEKVEVTWEMVLTAFCTFQLFIQQIQLLTLNRRLAAFTFSISFMFKDVSRNLVVILVISASFAAALTVMKEEDFDQLNNSLLLLFKSILGLAPPDSEKLRPSGLFTLILFIVIIDIGFLNILIAQLALAYETLRKDTEGYANMNRGFNCIEIESFIPQKWRISLFEKLEFDAPLEFDQGDEGPAGGIQELVPASQRNHPRYVPDRILRYTGVASGLDPWPKDDADPGDNF